MLDLFRAALSVARGFRGERISLRASALTYLSIFSLVPMLTVALALVEALGEEQFKQTLYGFVLEVLAPGIRQESADFLERVVEGADPGAAGWLGVIALLVSAGSLLKHLDSSLNEIWNVRRGRPLPIRLAIYTVILIFGPVLLTVSLSGMGLLRTILVELLPISGDVLAGAGVLVSVGGFTLLYLVAPNSKVRFRAALAGGVTAGLAWDAAKHVYGAAAAELFRRSPIWGSLSAVPLFLIWIYLSWLLLLFGARLAYAVQYAWFRGGVPELLAYPRSEAFIAARIAGSLARMDSLGSPPPDLRRLADETLIPVDALEPVLEALIRGGLIQSLPDGSVKPARPVNELTLADNALVVGAARATPPGIPEEKPAPGTLDGVLEEAEEAFLERLRRVSWSDLPALEDAQHQASGAPKKRSVIQWL